MEQQIKLQKQSVEGQTLVNNATIDVLTALQQSMTPASSSAAAAAAQGRTFEVQNATIKRNECSAIRGSTGGLEWKETKWE